MIRKLISDYLKEMGIKQIWLSEKTGMTQQALSTTLNGERNLDIEEYTKICDALGLRYDYYASSDHSYNASAVYHTSNPIYLPAGARLCVKATGSSASSILTVWDTYGNFVSSTAGNWDRWDRNFIAESDCYVTVSRRVTATTVTYTDSHTGETVSFAGPYFSDNDNGDNPPIVYVNSYLSESPLHGKKMLVIGDSLIYGHDVGNAITWSNLLAMKYGMTVDNQGINGSTVAVVSGKTTYPMCVRYANIETANPDIVIVEGGANDRNNRVPIGTNLDTDLSTFKGALNVLIDGLRAKYPRAVIMMMTTYHRLRSGGDNSMPDELLYSNAMLEVCEFRGIPCYNNMMSGIDLSNADIRAWADEGIWLGSSTNFHFSEEAYKKLAPQYEKWIEPFIP